MRATTISRREMFRAAVELTKPRVTRMAVIAVGVGFAVASTQRNWFPGELLPALLWCLLGAAFSGAGANALNQVMEVERDLLMSRTRVRPIPTGRLSRTAAMWIGLGLSVCGVAVLWLGTNGAAAAVSAFTIVSYLTLYTPLKSISPISTIVGAVPGALPPMIGWAAASTGAWHGLDRFAGWTLFLLIFVWQVPHVLAISLKYREQYAQAGHRVYPVIDRDGRRTGIVSVLWSLTLLPISLAPMWVLPGMLGAVYFSTALVLGMFMIVFSVRMAIERSRTSAHDLFVTSLVYLPVMLAVLVAEVLLARF